MTSPTVNLFVAPMRRRFKVPEGMPSDGFLADVAEALAGYSASQLASAADWFRDNREMRSFPTVAECRKACERYPTEGQQRALTVRHEGEAEKATQRRLEREREIAAFKLCRCAMGRLADREGWLPALIEFATDHQRLPDGHDVGDVQATAKRSEEGLERVRGGTFYAGLVELRKAMLDRAHENVFGFIERQSAPLPMAAE